MDAIKYPIAGQVREIIDRLVLARKNAGLTQTEAALMVGLSCASSLSQYESGSRKSVPTLTLFLKLCTVYEIDPVWALTGVDPDTSVTLLQDTAAKLSKIRSIITGENHD